jgi:hypothetical protein
VIRRQQTLVPVLHWNHPAAADNVLKKEAILWGANCDREV